MSGAATAVSGSTWRFRPPDQRFDTIDDLYRATKQRAGRTVEKQVSSRELEIIPGPDERRGASASIEVETPVGRFKPTYWSFSQLCSVSRWRACDMRDLVPSLVKLNIEFGLTFRAKKKNLNLYCDQLNGRLLALTSSTYERIFDWQVVDAVRNALQEAGWPSPVAGPSTEDGSGFYASDHDVFLFLVIPSATVEIQSNGGIERLHRGIWITNSETGSSSLKLQTFLYRWACGNRMIFGVRDVESLSIRHSKGARNRFKKEVLPWLREALQPVEPGPARKAVEWSMRTKVGADDKEIREWLRARGFTIRRIQDIIQEAKRQEGKAETVWDLVQGGTVAAQKIAHLDERVALEAEISRLIERGFQSAAKQPDSRAV